MKQLRLTARSLSVGRKMKITELNKHIAFHIFFFQDIDVAEELVKRGLANWSEEKFTSLSSSQTSLSEL